MAIFGDLGGWIGDLLPGTPGSSTDFVGSLLGFNEFNPNAGPIGGLMGGISGGNSGGSNVSTVTNITQPWGPQQDYLKYLFSEAQNLYQGQPPQYFPGSTVAGATQRQNLGRDMWAQFALGPAQGAYTRLQSAQDYSIDPSQMLDVGNNPYVQGAVRGAINPIFQRLSESILPQISDVSESAGGYGGSRDQLARGQAVGQAVRAAGDVSSKIMSDAYGQGLDNFLRGIALGPQTVQTGLLPGQTMEAVGAAERADEQAFLTDLVNRWNFQQNLPYQQLTQYQNLIQGGYGGTSTTTGTGAGYEQPETNRFQSALGGAATGFSVGGPWGALIGGVLGFALG